VAKGGGLMAGAAVRESVTLAGLAERARVAILGGPVIGGAVVQGLAWQWIDRDQAPGPASSQRAARRRDPAGAS
jgi:hypothetical protein